MVSFDFCVFMEMLAVGRSESFTGQTSFQYYATGQLQSGLDLLRFEDLWNFGRPRDYGGVWKDTHISAGEVSDSYPYL